MENQKNPNDSNLPNVAPAETVNPQPQPANQQQIAAPDPGRGLGIASLITAVLGFSLIGLILGILGLSKTKKAGFPTNVFALIGVIWSVISILLVTVILFALVSNNFNGAQSKAKDVQTKNDINYLHLKLEEYSSTNKSYPSTLTAETFPNFDSAALTDSNGDTITFGDTTYKTLEEAESQSLPTSEQMYQYLPYNCTGNNCGGYVVRGYIENSSFNVYAKNSLFNY